MNQLVSIVVPTYNGARYIRSTVDSLLAQTYKNIEVIVIDDGSTDDTSQIVRSFGRSVRLIKQGNAGVSKARNRGASEARGSFICFCDHDDYWYAEKVEQQIATFAARPALGVVYTEFIRWVPDSEGMFRQPSEIDQGKQDEYIDEALSGWIYHQLLIDCWVLTSSAMIKADVLKEAGAFNEALPYGEDWDLWLRISRTREFAKLKRPLVLYRQHGMQGSRVVRDTDYRTKILSEAAAKWGLASPNGRSITSEQFHKNIARYHVSYGLNTLAADRVLSSWGAFFKGWLAHPLNARPIAYVVLSIFGWRPRQWSSMSSI